MTLSPDAEAATSALAARLNDPQVANSLASLLDHADLLALLVQGLDGFIARSEIIGDSLLANITDLRSTVENNPAIKESGVDLQSLADAGASLAAVLPQAAPGMVSAVESGVIDKLLASGIFGPDALGQIELLARGLVRGGDTFNRQPVEVGGPVSLLRVLKDPDVSRALSFFATVAKAIGQELAAAPTTTPSHG